MSRSRSGSTMDSVSTQGSGFASQGCRGRTPGRGASTARKFSGQGASGYLRVMIERRRRRSNDPRQALTFLLDALAERHDLRAMALADERGRLIAGTGRDTVRLAHAGRNVVLGEEDPSFEDVSRGADL